MAADEHRFSPVVTDCPHCNERVSPIDRVETSSLHCPLCQKRVHP